MFVIILTGQALYSLINASSMNKKNSLISFGAVLTILTTFTFVLMFRNITRDSYGLWGGLMMWVPAISAIFTSLIHKDSLKTYGWKPGKIKYLAFSYFVPLLVGITAYGVAWSLGIIEFYGDEASNYKWVRMLGIETPAPVLSGIASKLVSGTLIISVLALGEEIGWSGFLIPELLKTFSIPVTSVIAGLFWSIWHYPAIIGGIYGYGVPLALTLIGFTLVLTGISLFKTYYVSKSKSLWPGVLIHTSHNVITMGILFDLTVKSKYAAYFVSESGIITAGIYVFGAILFYRFQIKRQLIKKSLTVKA